MNMFAWQTLWVYLLAQALAGVAAGATFLALNPNDRENGRPPKGHKMTNSQPHLTKTDAWIPAAGDEHAEQIANLNSDVLDTAAGVGLVSNVAGHLLNGVVGHCVNASPAMSRGGRRFTDSHDVHHPRRGNVETAVPPLRPLRCVIVDDSQVIAEIATNLLGRDGITVVGVASNIAEALYCVAALKPDITVVDVHLGGESGFELAEQLASVASPVILTSTYSEQEFTDMITESAAIGFVSKFDLSPEAIRHLLVDANAQPQ